MVLFPRARKGISNKKHGLSDDHLLMEDGNMYSATLPPDWVSNVDSVNATIVDIQSLMSELASMHASRIGTVFGRDLDAMEKQIERKTTEVTNLFRKAERYLQKVGACTRRAGGEEATVGANVQRSLAMQLQELSSDFRQKQRKYLGDVKAQKSGGLVESETRFGINLEDDGTLQHDFSFGSTQQLSVVDDLQAEIQSRDKEISQIAKSIEELGAIFKELAVLVIDQGTILDRIDYNMEAVVEHTKEGIQQLEKAEKSQKSARPMKCIICLLCTIAVLLLILVMKHRH
jgi:syntaxin 16